MKKYSALNVLIALQSTARLLLTLNAVRFLFMCILSIPVAIQDYARLSALGRPQSILYYLNENDFIGVLMWTLLLAAELFVFIRLSKLSETEETVRKATGRGLVFYICALIGSVLLLYVLVDKVYVASELSVGMVLTALVWTLCLIGEVSLYFIACQAHRIGAFGKKLLFGVFYFLIVLAVNVVCGYRFFDVFEIGYLVFVIDKLIVLMVPILCCAVCFLRWNKAGQTQA